MAVIDWLANLARKTRVNVPLVDIKRTPGTGIPFIDFDSNNPKPAPKPQSGDQIAQTINQGPTAVQGWTDGGGYYTGGGGGGTTDSTAALKSDILNKWNTLQSVFQGLFGDVDSNIRNRSGELSKDYDDQIGTLVKGYGTATGGTSSAYAARGLSDSSYLSDAQQQNTDIYDQSLKSLADDKTSKLAELGRFGESTKARYGAAKDSFGQSISRLDDYDEAGLGTLDSQLGGAIGDASAARAGLGSDQQYIEGLSKISPIQQQGTAQLAARLKTLVQSAAPAQAKKYIAQGLIKASSLNDANANAYWSNYFEQLLNGQG